LIKFFRFINKKYSFNDELFSKVVETVISAQDAIIDKSEYPTPEIAASTKKYRNLGLGYTNLGGLLMWLGLPYDSDEGRYVAALITAALTGTAYKTSADLADKIGSFRGYEKNKGSFKRVLQQHYGEMGKLLNNAPSNISTNHKSLIEDLMVYCSDIWENVIKRDRFRNAQVSLLAPTGTISSIMNSATTGLEPEYSIVRYKRLAGSDGATLKYTNSIIKDALLNLEYNETDIPKIIDQLIDHNVPNKTLIKKEHLPIFFTAANLPGTNLCINYMGHIKMCAAVQPFLSGAISKTINLPKDCTVDDIYNLYIESWKLGLKGVTVYRDGSKNFQPLTTKTSDIKKPKKLIRKKLPAERPAITHKFRVGNSEGYVTCGFYEDTKELGEIFINVSKEGSTLSGFADALATIISISLQYGVPLKDLVNKLSYLKFEPNGFTSNANIKTASSIVDYIARYIGSKFLSEEDQTELGLVSNSVSQKIIDNADDDGTSCPNCGSLMRKLGSCYLCVNCGHNAGACG